MSEWDTAALHREALDAVQAAIAIAERAKALLDEITAISGRLRKLGEFTSVRVVSANDSTWDPCIDARELFVYIRATLEKRRDELRAEFNKLGKQRC